ncbi:hypothetical protein [Sulfurimonas sp. HSL-1716]|uniref:hypothetical protein n=1 Tax=Hydrocurvibacter sulfurireducens TaxID=3131937 RepID=UPI0031F82142
MKAIFKSLFYTSILLMSVGCSTSIQTKAKLSSIYADTNSTTRGDVSISVFALKNYTDTPRAGMRASNIIDGVLIASGYRVVSHIQDGEKSFEEMRAAALKDNSKYFLYGGVSEWRYKTGIDGEPAVSLKCVLYETKSSRVIWSSTASDSDWGNASVGTTAQKLIESMIED